SDRLRFRPLSLSEPIREVGEMDFKHIPEAPGVYLLRNRCNRKRYGGEAENMRERVRSHVSALQHGRHRNCGLQTEWDALGRSNFTVEAVCVVRSKPERLMIEHLVIHRRHLLNPHFGYNEKCWCGLGPVASQRLHESRLLTKGLFKLLPGIELYRPMSV